MDVTVKTEGPVRITLPDGSERSYPGPVSGDRIGRIISTTAQDRADGSVDRRFGLSYAIGI